MAATTPIHQVLEDGSVRELGEWVGAERRLHLHRSGFPLLGPGDHEVEGELPWLFWDMAPSGFLGRRFARVEPGMHLPSDPRTWSASQVLRVLSEAGEDLSGNLLIGWESLERWRKRGEVDVVPLEERKRRIQWDADEAPGSSFVGGERPKRTLTATSGGVLLKASPRVGPPVPAAWGERPMEHASAAQRWADLLRLEAHCSEVLRAHGLGSAVGTVTYSFDGHVVLEVRRFDRLPNGGRRGAATLYWYAMARHGDVQLPAPEVVRGLVADGHLPPSAFDTVSAVHAFSAAIGNTDAHLGNYGLVFDEAGRARLAPFFDILPMALAPQHDELPDPWLSPRAPLPTDAQVRPWVEDLLARVDADPTISDDFRHPWHRLLGV